MSFPEIQWEPQTGVSSTGTLLRCPPIFLFLSFNPGSFQISQKVGLNQGPVAESKFRGLPGRGVLRKVGEGWLFDPFPYHSWNLGVLPSR